MSLRVAKTGLAKKKEEALKKLKELEKTKVFWPYKKEQVTQLKSTYQRLRKLNEILLETCPKGTTARKGVVLKTDSSGLILHDKEGKKISITFNNVAKDYFPHLPFNLLRIFYIPHEYQTTRFKKSDLMNPVLIDITGKFNNIKVRKKEIPALALGKINRSIAELVDTFNTPRIENRGKDKNKHRSWSQILKRPIFFPQHAVKNFFPPERVKRAFKEGITPNALAYYTKDPMYIHKLYKEWLAEQKEAAK